MPAPKPHPRRASARGWQLASSRGLVSASRALLRQEVASGQARGAVRRRLWPTALRHGGSIHRPRGALAFTVPVVLLYNQPSVVCVFQGYN